VVATRHAAVFLLPALRVPHTASGLGTSGLGTVLYRQSKRYPTILVDAPPVLTNSAAVLAAEWCTAALLVVRAGLSKRGDVARSVERLRTLGTARVLTVLNGLERHFDVD
jgi:Mrp family chromosome partitioning ATPase